MLFKREKGYLISFFYIRDDEYGFSSVSITSKKKIRVKKNFIFYKYCYFKCSKITNLERKK